MIPFVDNLIFFFLNLTISIACSLKNPQNFLMQSLPLYISCLFFMLIKEDILEMKNLMEYVQLLM